MRPFWKWPLVTLLSLFAMWVHSEDIDLFASGLASGASASALPNVIFVLDNTSNWSRESQKWPDGTQGQSEVRAIRVTLERLLSQNKDINVALLEFTTDGPAIQDGGYVRFDLQRLSDTAAEFFDVLEQIELRINDPSEKRNANSAYGNLASDIYAYLAGERQSFAGQGTPVGLVDQSGYQQPYEVFDSPLAESDVCSETYVILASNPDANGPEEDTSENSDRLRALYSALNERVSAALAGESGSGVFMPEYAEAKFSSSQSEEIGFSSLGYQKPEQCTATVNGNMLQSDAIQDACPEGGNCACSSQFQRCQGGLKCYLVKRPIAGQLAGQYTVTGNEVDGSRYNLDDWTKFLHDFGVPVAVQGSGEDVDPIVRVPVTTYTLDIFNEKPSAMHSSLMHSAAELGGGYRQSVNNQAEMERALGRIFADIIDVNTSFAAVTLPLSATNRAQSENKVFVGMFRPASGRKPRWVGNLKQYQLAKFDGQVELADVNYDRAINPQTGFARSCATSFWTLDTTTVSKANGAAGPYFDGLQLEPSPVSECLAEFRGERSALSDSPDGPFVEKGGAAQQIRNQYSGQRNSERIIYTQLGANDLSLVSERDAGGPEFLAYLTGEDAGLRGGDLEVPDGNGGFMSNPSIDIEEQEPYEGLRPTVHGDIVHSRPLTLTYGPVDPSNPSLGSDFLIFYGANDGLFRSLDPSNGQEKWALIAGQHLEAIERLYRNTPTIDYFGLDESLSAAIGAEAKQYFFDGSTGFYTEYDANSELTTGWIFPTMRRGGREIYALDVSPTGAAGEPPATPIFMWKLGCPSLTSDDGCSTGFTDIGQTWSTPVAGLVGGYSGNGGGATAPVLIFGGGWDNCLDEQTPVLSLDRCEKGNRLYVVNARTGVLLRAFETEAPVVAEVSGLDIDNDGLLDFVYAADATGNLYRLNFSTIESLADSSAESLSSDQWFVTHVAQSSRENVRFFNKPSIGAVQNRIFLTFGSGDRERPLKRNYPFLEDISNRFYAFIDEPYRAQATVVDLDQPGIDDVRGMFNAATGLAPDVRLIDRYRGWYLDLLDRGEQVVNPAAISGGEVFFNTFQPEGGTRGFCGDLGTSKAYRVSLFQPQNDEGSEFGQGMPIPPIIVNVKLDSGAQSCTGPNCGPGIIPEETATVCIGCEGFNPVVIAPDTDGTVREAYHAENIDRL